MNLSITALAVVLGYLVAITAFGSYLGRRRKSVNDYFLADRSVPWWAIAACVVATETSTLTFTSVPGFAYVGNWGFLQLALGFLLGRILVSAILVPAYFRGELFTSYELLQRRFGPSVRSAAAAVFLVSRTLADGVRLHAAALVIAIVVGVPESICIVVLAAAMIFYTEEGGVKATIWTDVIQMFVYLREPRSERGAPDPAGTNVHRFLGSGLRWRWPSWRNEPHRLSRLDLPSCLTPRALPWELSCSES